MTKTSRHIVHRNRQRHALLGILLAIPLIIIGLTGCLLALKQPLADLKLGTSSDPWPWIYDLHRSLAGGTVGRVLFSLFGLSLWLIVISGLRSFVRRPGRNLSVHAQIGRLLGIPLAITASIGSVLNFAEPLSNWLDPIPQIYPTASRDKAPLYGSSVSEAQTLAAKATADAVHTANDLVKIYPPKDERPYLIFYYRDHTRIYIDPVTATLLKVRTSTSHWTSALLPLHGLSPLGALGHAIMVLLGISLMWLSGKGILRLKQRLHAKWRVHPLGNRERNHTNPRADQG